MNVNQRWLRDHNRIKRLTWSGIAGAAALWLISFYASIPAAFGATVHEAWFGFASIVTFIGATGLTIASGLGISAVLSDDKPLDGSNG